MELARKKLVRLGIACELHRDFAGEVEGEIPSYPELWIKREEDFGAAVRIFSRLTPEDAVYLGS
jgi:hypothetical protein